MKTNKIWGMITLTVGVMFVFALSGCSNDPPPPKPTWQSTHIEITGTWSNNTINFTYSESQGTITKNGGGGNTLDGVWNGTFDGDTVRVTVSGSNWTMAVLDSGKYVEYAKGTVTASNTNLTIMVTHIMDYGESYDSGSGGPNVPPGGPGGQVIGSGTLVLDDN
jgi:hypothetical protein